MNSMKLFLRNFFFIELVVIDKIVEFIVDVFGLLWISVIDCVIFVLFIIYYYFFYGRGGSVIVWGINFLFYF